jgi:hypothetical protein
MHDYNIVYTRLRELPNFVRYLCFTHNSWIVGGGAKFLCGLTNNIKDWDIIVPLIEWRYVSKSIPYQSKTNTFGGIKIIENNIEIDIWAEDLGSYFQEAGGSFSLIAVAPKTQQICVCNKR